MGTFRDAGVPSAGAGEVVERGPRGLLETAGGRERGEVMTRIETLVGDAGVE